ncbi:MAG: D-alanine--D-alanine ligase [Patescibacteria group bacterium]|nr:D-alanine--D-alanine ligase [Patescibacteria group bacterium]
MAKKLKVAVIYGGRSGEHEVSLQSAASVIAALNPKKYDVLPIRIAKDGRWLNEPQLLPDRKPRQLKATKATPINSLVAVTEAKTSDGLFDVVLPIAHGTGGEDGSLQGMLELAGLPYVGSGVLGSAVGMDKAVQKNILRQAGVPVVKSVDFRVGEWERGAADVVRKVVRALGFPVFIKPANLGSSVGISKARDERELVKGIKEALRYDTKIIIEEGLENIREIECAVIGETEWPRTSVPGEVVTGHDFYDYHAKYTDGESRVVIPARLPSAVAKKVRRLAGQVFTALDAHGLARVDFFVTKSARPKIIVNEINTIPGFTRFSMFPRLWEATGLPYDKLLDELIRLALVRGNRQKSLIRDFRPAPTGDRGGRR